ncbi:uncharacterized protein STEHIDRAFT_155300 [Stereum hirsutum FP-91666 SS1]|uniref:uncharacterized protein n=1 Tax=Stereum hirsutum (strain FP-91666) TaxID=721885 RepID=UPI000440BCDD|nr:uncharacterized protein STEHIDRAFT_155300 [Stereum hirsutum FP-91666 SS1]EIM87940.1 hypothetical protein STEHIDRAFT_155300 [Stereum hirsutum FP-91666 SS1]
MRIQSIHSLPTELTLDIVNRLHAKDVLRFSMTCKRFHNLVTTSSLLQYHLDLFAFGLADNQYSNLPSRPISDRHNRLLELQASWRTLSWKRTFELTNFNSELDHDLPEVYQGVMICPDWEMKPVVCHLPTYAEPEHSRVIHVSAANNNVKVYGNAYAIDPTLNLFAFLAVHADTPDERVGRIHLRSLSSCSANANDVGSEWVAHPDAAVAFLECVEDLDSPGGSNAWDLEDPDIFVVDDLLAFWKPKKKHLVGWKWQSGVKILDTHLGFDNTDTHTSTITFLDARCFIASNLSGSGSLDLYTFSKENCAFPRAGDGVTGNNLDGADSKGAVRRAASFHLPSVHTDVHIINITISGYPASSPENLSVSSITSPFILTSDAHLYVLGVWYQVGKRGSNSLNNVGIMGTKPVFQCRLVIHAHELFERLHSKGVHATADRDTHRSPDPDRRHTTTGSNLDAVEFSWSEWGPKSTRLFHDGLDGIPVESTSSDVTALNPLTISDSELCSIHGQRISLTSPMLLTDHDLYNWHVLEFGHHLKRLDEMHSGHPNIATTANLDNHQEEDHDSRVPNQTITNKSIRIVLTPSIFPRHRNIDLFQEDVITMLPYREVKMDNMRADLCFIDHERIVTAHVDDDPTTGEQVMRWQTMLL